jgi:IclR family transcriptional regulator, pca regulon regulatory protein
LPYDIGHAGATPSVGPEACVPVSRRSPASREDEPTKTPAEGDAERSGRFSSSLRAGLAILNCFSAEQPVLGIANLADELSMSRSTTHRYASTLVALGYLEQDQARRYRLAPRVVDVGMSVLDSMALRGKAREHLRELREQTGRTVSLAVLDGGDVRYVDRLRGWRRGQHAVDLNLGVGARVPANCSAMGKVLLANLPEGERDRVIAELDLTRRGPKSITSKRALRAELEQVREDGLAVGDEELAPGVRTLAAPVIGPDGEVLAAIGMPVPADAFTREELLDVLGEPLRAAAKRLSAALRV